MGHFQPLSVHPGERPVLGAYRTLSGQTQRFDCQLFPIAVVPDQISTEQVGIFACAREECLSFIIFADLVLRKSVGKLHPWHGSATPYVVLWRHCIHVVQTARCDVDRVGFLRVLIGQLGSARSTKLPGHVRP